MKVITSKKEHIRLNDNNLLQSATFNYRLFNKTSTWYFKTKWVWKMIY